MATSGPWLRGGACHRPAVLVAAAAAASHSSRVLRPCRPIGRLRLPEVPQRAAALRLRAAAARKPQPLRSQTAPTPTSTTRWRAARVLVVVAAYVSTDLGVFTCTDLAGSGYLRPAVMCVSAFSSFLLGAGVSWLRDGYKGLQTALQPSRWLALLPVSGMFCLGTWCTLHAVTRLSPVFVKVLLQLNIPVTAFLSMLILKRRYTVLQLQALRNAFLAVIAFTTSRLDGLGNPFRGNADLEIGILFTVLALFANASATLFAEKAMKRETPWYTTFAQIKAGDAASSFALLCLVPGAPLRLQHVLRRPSLLTEGFSPAVWQLATVLVMDAWMSAMVVKQLSSVVKALAKGLSMLVLYLVVQRFFHLRGEPTTLPMVCVAVLLVSALQEYAYASWFREKQEQARTLAESSEGAQEANRPSASTPLAGRLQNDAVEQPKELPPKLERAGESGRWPVAAPVPAVAVQPPVPQPLRSENARDEERIPLAVVIPLSVMFILSFIFVEVVMLSPPS